MATSKICFQENFPLIRLFLILFCVRGRGFFICPCCDRNDIWDNECFTDKDDVQFNDMSSLSRKELLNRVGYRNNDHLFQKIKDQVNSDDALDTDIPPAIEPRLGEFKYHSACSKCRFVASFSCTVRPTAGCEGSDLEDEDPFSSYAMCADEFCKKFRKSESMTTCQRCFGSQSLYCITENCSKYCEPCDEIICVDCSNDCERCKKTICRECTGYCETCDVTLCNNGPHDFIWNASEPPFSSCNECRCHEDDDESTRRIMNGSDYSWISDR